jgi:outer membrane protein OmpA-like peptidoglycan-associated protein
VSPLAQVEAGLSAAAASSGVQVSSLADGGLQLRATGDAAFGSAKATLSPRFTAFLQALARELQAHPELTASITGHTDSQGGAKANERLSTARARATQHQLLSQGVVASRVTAEGKGAREPIAGNDSAEGRAANRRVDIVLATSDPR